MIESKRPTFTVSICNNLTTQLCAEASRRNRDKKLAELEAANKAANQALSDGKPSS